MGGGGITPSLFFILYNISNYNYKRPVDKNLSYYFI